MNIYSVGFAILAGLQEYNQLPRYVEAPNLTKAVLKVKKYLTDSKLDDKYELDNIKMVVYKKEEIL